MFQMGSVGPMLGQTHHFRIYAPEKIAYAIDRYSNEAKRLYGVMDKRLATQPATSPADEYTIADIAIFPWLRSWKNQGIDWADYPAPEGLVRRDRRAAGGAARRRGAGRAAQAAVAPTRSARCCSARRSTSGAEPPRWLQSRGATQARDFGPAAAPRASSAWRAPRRRTRSSAPPPPSGSRSPGVCASITRRLVSRSRRSLGGQVARWDRTPPRRAGACALPSSCSMRVCEAAHRRFDAG